MDSVNLGDFYIILALRHFLEMTQIESVNQQDGSCKVGRQQDGSCKEGGQQDGR